VPEGAFYFFPSVAKLIGTTTPDGNKIQCSGDYVMYLLNEAHVASVDGAAFCAPGYIRISYATSDDNIREAMRRIKEATDKLK
jgi:aspartate aminotransferase